MVKAQLLYSYVLKPTDPSPRVLSQKQSGARLGILTTSSLLCLLCPSVVMDTLSGPPLWCGLANLMDHLKMDFLGLSGDNFYDFFL